MKEKEYLDVEDNDSSGDNRGKFSDKIKKIRTDKVNSKKKKEENFIVRGGRNILKIGLAMPMMVYSSFKSNNKADNNKNVGKIKKGDEVSALSTIFVDTSDKELVVNFDSSEILKAKKLRVNKIKDIDVKLLKNEKANLLKLKSNSKKAVVSEEDKKVHDLQNDIIKLIRKKLVKNINELEILYSELYLLKEVNGDDLYLDKCRNDIQEVKRLLSKIKVLKGKYNYLKTNFDFDNILEYDDEMLADKILELKEMCSSDDIKYVIDNYKILEEYKYLYLKIDQLENDAIEYNKYKLQKEAELRQRDIDFEELKKSTANVDKESERYKSFIEEQNNILKMLNDNASKIDSHEVVSYRIKGFGALLGNSFKYLGLLLLSPFKGLIPSIATQTVFTRNTVDNLYQNLAWEEKRKMVYEAVDYSLTINFAMSSLENNLSLLNYTLSDIVRLKDKYNKEFDGSLIEYKSVMSKLNKLENAMINNKVKIELMLERVREKEKINRDKMYKAKKLNSSENN